MTAPVVVDKQNAILEQSFYRRNKSTVFSLVSMLFMVLIFVAVSLLLSQSYYWSGQNAFVGMFSPVDSSVWELIKLLFYSLLISYLFVPALFKYNEDTNFANFVVSFLYGAIAFVFIYYTIRFAFTKTYYWQVMTASFVIASFIAIVKFFSAGVYPEAASLLCLFLMVSFVFIFSFATYFKPSLPIFHAHNSQPLTELTPALAQVEPQAAELLNSLLSTKKKHRKHNKKSKKKVCREFVYTESGSSSRYDFYNDKDLASCNCSKR